MKTSSRFHSVLVFLGFVVIAAIFWLVLALNDSMQSSYTVRISIVNKPDSVTFISDVPKDFHASVRDRGTSLLRSAVISKPSITVNFRDYASDGHFRLSKADVNALLKVTFGASASILSSSLDSLNLIYTTNKGKRVPVAVSSDVTPAPGMVLAGEPSATPHYAMIYGPRSILDTLNRVFTESVVKRDVDENSSYDVGLIKIPGVRIDPSKVRVDVKVEPLVAKSAIVPIRVVGVPEGESMLLFPAQVTVDYFIPMSRFSAESSPEMRAEVEYADALLSLSGKVGVKLVVSDKRVLNPVLKTDSVEYTIVK